MKPLLNFPLKVFKKLYRIVKTELNELKLSESKRLEELILSYESVGLIQNRYKNIELLNKCLKSLDLAEYEEKNGMYSEHLIIFTALSKLDSKPKNILEIGTYDGKTASILASLFPESTITTLDLKDHDPIFTSSISSYTRDDNSNDFIRKRDNLIKRHKNISFIQANSLNLTFSESLKGQDLIWIDGAHGYPVVVSDITNCLRLLSDDGIIMCDDVWKKKVINDPLFSSIATYESLCSFSEANIIETTFFNKRIGKSFNCDNKFISYSKIRKDYQKEIK